MNLNKEALSDRLVKVRAKMNWTQKQLADYLGVGMSTLWRWETLGDFPNAVKFIQIDEKLEKLEK